MLSRFLLPLLAMLLALLPMAAHALNPSTQLQDYNRASWLTKDGAPPEIQSMAQTKDGWLWLAGTYGLHRFDGVRFEKYRLPFSQNTSRSRVIFVRAHTNGDLWISYALGGGLSVVHPDGKLEDIIPIGQLPPVAQLAFDDNGDIWSVTIDGAFRIHQGKALPLGAEHGLPKELHDARIDRYGRLWMAGDTAVYLYDRALGKFQTVRDLPMRSVLIESPDGRLWSANYQQIQALPAPADPAARMSAARIGSSPGFGSDWVARFDRDGNLWQLKCPNDICVTPAHVVAATSLISAAQQAPAQVKPSSGTPNFAGNAILEDREHNIWVATVDGVDRYRDNRLQRIRLTSGRAAFSMVNDENGQTWAADPFNTMVWRMKGGAEPELDPTAAYIVSADFGGALLLAGAREIERRQQGKVEKIAYPAIPGPDGKPQSFDPWGLTDDGMRLWLMSKQTGLIARRDGQWLPRSKFNLPKSIVLGIPGVKRGQLWIASGDHAVALLDENDKLTSYPAAMIGVATGIFTGEDIVASGDQGLAVFIKDGFRQLTAADPEVLQEISGLAITPDGDRWLNGGKGLVHVRRDDWKASVASPELALRYELFGLQEGYIGKAMLLNRQPSARVDKDGNLWLASTSGMLRLDTRNIQRNPVAPVADVASIQAGAANYKIEPGLTLPAGSKNVSFTYTAASLRLPEAVRFQYRLDGADSDWQDAGARRAAYYTNMSPGTYRFRVRAANEDGLWSEQPATVDFDIPATFTQTLWFKAVCLLALALLLYLLYLYRLRIVTARLEERMEVRMAERERIARTLHDTFLQTVQGVVLRLDAAVDALPDDSAARKSLSAVLHSARTSITEGRAQVHELRSADVDEVESRLRHIAALLSASYPGVHFTLEASGKRSALRATVVDDISEIASEALRNAYQHAQAAQIEVQLNYEAQQFALLVRDNGRGMSPAPASGHWGLVGMRERAARIGAALEISSTQNQGSNVKMTLSARRAYAASHASWWRRLFGK
jgi:signal transduction histidine kinase/ligand-binding sensor domain-containing protein